MDDNVHVVVLDKSKRIKNGFVFSFNDTKNRMGTYRKEKIDKFKKKISEFLGVVNIVVRNIGDKLYDAYFDLDIAIDDSIDRFTDKVFDSYSRFKKNHFVEKNEQSPTEDFSLNNEDLSLGRKPSSYTLEPIMTDEELMSLGIDIEHEEDIAELKEFKKELLMENFQANVPEQNDITRRSGR